MFFEELGNSGARRSRDVHATRDWTALFFLIFNGFSNSEFKKQSAIKLVTVAFAPIEALFVLFVWALTLEIRKVE